MSNSCSKCLNIYFYKYIVLSPLICLFNINISMERGECIYRKKKKKEKKEKKRKKRFYTDPLVRLTPTRYQNVQNWILYRMTIPRTQGQCHQQVWGVDVLLEIGRVHILCTLQDGVQKSELSTLMNVFDFVQSSCSQCRSMRIVILQNWKSTHFVYTSGHTNVQLVHFALT